MNIELFGLFCPLFSKTYLAVLESNVISLSLKLKLPAIPDWTKGGNDIIFSSFAYIYKVLQKIVFTKTLSDNFIPRSLYTLAFSHTASSLEASTKNSSAGNNLKKAMNGDKGGVTPYSLIIKTTPQRRRTSGTLHFSRLEDYGKDREKEGRRKSF